jgi:hypothetical protein
VRSTLRVVYIDFGTTVDIGRPAREVRAVLADYDRDPEWRAGVLSMSADPPGCATAGTTTAEVMRFAGRTLRNNGKIARVGPGCGLTWRTTSGVDAEGVRAVEPRGPDRCRLTPSGTRQQPDQGGEHCTVGPVQPRPGILPPQYRHLLVQHQQFGIPRSRRTRQQHHPPGQADKDQVEHAQGHKHAMLPAARRLPQAKPQVSNLRPFWNPQARHSGVTISPGRPRRAGCSP